MVIDFQALWQSTKILSVDRKYHDMYAHLLGLSQVSGRNGPFEANPQLVWALVYAPTRPDQFTVAEVEEGMSQFERANMLDRYVEDGKAIAWPVGLDKPGRLPPPGRYKSNKTPLPLPPHMRPATVVTAKLPLDMELDRLCREHFHKIEDRKHAYQRTKFKEALKLATDNYGYDVVLPMFRDWCKVGNYIGIWPVTEFLEQMNAAWVPPPPGDGESEPVESDGTGPITYVAPVSPTQAVEDRIALLSDNTVFFQPVQRTVLAGVIRKHGDDVVVDAFREFLSALPSDADRRWAGRDFTEQVATRVRTVLRTRKLRDKAKDDLAASLAASKIEAVERYNRLAPTEGESELD